VTVSIETAGVDYTGNGVTTAFAVPFPFQANSHIVLTRTDLYDTESELIEGVHYTLTGAGSPTGGTATLTVALPSGYGLSVRRNVPFTQETAFTTQGTFSPVLHERALDKNVMQIQQVAQSQVTLQNQLTADVNALRAALASQQASLQAEIDQLRADIAAGGGGGGGIDLGPLDSRTVLSTGSTRARTLAKRFSEVRNVMDFGAEGDGVHDDTPAIRAAILAVENQGGGVVYMPRGDYNICVQETTRGNNEYALMIGESNVTLQGAGRKASRLKLYAPGLANPATNWAIYRTAGISARQASHAYVNGDRVLSDGHEWQATNNGTTGPGAGPTYAGMTLVTTSTTEGFFVDGGVTWRMTDHMFVGHGILIKKRTNQNVDYIKNVVLKDFSIDGMVGWPDLDYPLSAGGLQPWTGGGYTETTTGKVFDATNEAIRVDGNLIDGVRLEGLEITGTRAEGFYYGGSTCKNVQILDCDVHNTGGSGISASAGMIIQNCRLWHMGTGVESFHRDQDIQFVHNEVFDCINGYVDGGNVDLFGVPWGRCTLRDNKFSNIHVRGFTNAGYGENYEIASNFWIDCGISSVDQEAIRISSFFGGSPRNVSIHDNLILADTHNPASGISLTGSMSRVEVFNNHIDQTQQAVASGKYVGFPINLGIDPSSTRIRFRNNKWRTSSGVHVGVVGTTNTTGFWEPNNYSLQDNGLAFQLQNANGSTNMYLSAPRHVIGGSSNHAYNNVPSLLNSTNMEDFQTVLIQSAGSNLENFCSINQTSSGHDLKTKRFLNPLVALLVQKDSVSGKWKEVDYYLAANHGEVTANDLELASPNRLIDQTTVVAGDTVGVIEAYGTKRVRLAPTSGMSFGAWRNFQTDTDVRVVINENVTLLHNVNLKLSGSANWTPGGKIGRPVFRVPAGSTVAYEVAGMRITY
jgi:hypothetical protein